MGMFSDMTTDGLETQGDRLGGGGFNVATGLYDATIKVAYVGNSASSKAMSVTVVAEVDEGGSTKEIKETIWISNRDNENFFKDKQDPTKKVPLPGFTTVDDICLLVTGHPLAEQDTEMKTVKVYDPEHRKEMPKEVPVIAGLTGQKTKLGILRVKENKQKKGDDGKYHDTEETRLTNNIDKVFHAETGRTVTEYREGVEQPVFMDAWVKANTDETGAGKDRDKTKKGGGGAGSSGQGRPGGAAKKSASTSLFGS